MRADQGRDQVRRRLVGIGVGVGVWLAAVQVFAQTATEFTGLLYPQHDLVLSVHTAGVVERIHPALGERVRAGQPILRQQSPLQEIEQQRRQVILNDASEQRAVEQRRVVLAAMLRDARLLHEQAGTVSLDELRKLEMEFSATIGRAEQLQEAKKRERIEFTQAEKERALRVLVAPVAGVVTQLKARPGEWAAPGDALVRLVDDSVCELRVNVSAAAARQLSPGAAVKVLVDDPAVKDVQTGRVTFVSPVIDPASSLVEVRARIANPQRRLRPGSTARLHIEGVL